MKLKVSHRELKSKKLKDLRKDWYVPWIVYGKYLEEPIMITCLKNDFLKIYKQAGYSTPITLSWEKIDQMVLIQDISQNPVTDMVIHVDFLAINKDEKVITEVPVILTGESEIEKLSLWKIQLIKDSVNVEALPKDLPHNITVDISVIKTLNDVIFIKDLIVDKSVKVMDDLDQAIITVFALQDFAKEEEEAKVAAEAAVATATTEAAWDAKEEVKGSDKKQESKK